MHRRKGFQVSMVAAGLAILAGCLAPAGDLPADPEDVAMAEALRRAEDRARAVGEANEEEWAGVLALPANAALRERAAVGARLLAGEADVVAAPRFTQTLALCDEAFLRLPRTVLLAGLEARLASLRHVRREPSVPGGIDDVPETLAGCAGKLARCDLHNLRLLLDWLAEPGTVGAILRLGAADRADAASEHGGVLAVSEGRLVLRPLPTMFGGNDLAYITPDAAMDAVPLSLALFHLHFHQADNAASAGPGGGDLAFAGMHRVSCVVFTSVGERSFDADYYNPDGAVVDLGVYHSGE